MHRPHLCPSRHCWVPGATTPCGSAERPCLVASGRRPCSAVHPRFAATLVLTSRRPGRLGVTAEVVRDRVVPVVSSSFHRLTGCALPLSQPESEQGPRLDLVTGPSARGRRVPGPGQQPLCGHFASHTQRPARAQELPEGTPCAGPSTDSAISSTPGSLGLWVPTLPVLSEAVATVETQGSGLPGGALPTVTSAQGTLPGPLPPPTAAATEPPLRGQGPQWAALAEDSLLAQLDCAQGCGVRSTHTRLLPATSVLRAYV